MHTFISTLKHEAKAVGSSPTKLLKASGLSDANWYNWTGGRSNPSEQVQKKVLQTIEKMKATQNPVHVQTVSNDADKPIRVILAEKKLELLRLNTLVSNLEAIVTQL